jgi:hypothetical protein
MKMEDHETFARVLADQLVAAREAAHEAAYEHATKAAKESAERAYKKTYKANYVKVYMRTYRTEIDYALGLKERPHGLAVLRPIADQQIQRLTDERQGVSA